MFDQLIKVNLPLTEEAYASGNGEGVWVKVNKVTKDAYDRDDDSKGYFGILDNDSVYYPGLTCGDIIPFEMRGEKRPVADFPNFLASRKKITVEEQTALIMAIGSAQASASYSTKEQIGTKRMGAVYTICPSIKVQISQKDIDDIMCTALEGGICSWCIAAEVDGEYLGDFACDQISRGGTLILHNAENGEAYTLTRDKFLTGLKRYFEEGCHVKIEDGRLDTSDIDANDADCIIQFALFGEVIFG